MTVAREVLVSIRTRMTAVLCLALFALPGTPAAQQRVVPVPSHTPLPSASQLRADLQRDSVVAVVRAQVGRRYRYGGEDPERGFDCSGLIRYVMSAFNLRLPRTAALQSLIGQPVPQDTSRLRPGDLLTFGKGKRVTHVGIYVGNGRYVHASSVAGRVVESELTRPQSHLVRAWYGVRRVLSGDSSAVAVR